jgi:medium-chain acyl-[acyl-carrier-protein] hydrolase
MSQTFAGANALLDRWLLCFQRRPAAKLRLICFAHAGGSASAFAAWQRELPESVELCAVKLPGRDERRAEPARTDLARLTGELLEALRPAHDRSVALLGYSLGALLAFEYARGVRRAGIAPPVHLMALASRAPQLARESSIAGISDSEFVHQMRVRYDGIPKPILDDPDLLAYFLPIMRADVGLLESYRYEHEAPLSCNITALGGERDPRITHEALAAWGVHTQGKCEALTVPGGHFFVTPDSRARLLRLIAERLGALPPPPPEMAL